MAGARCRPRVATHWLPNKICCSSYCTWRGLHPRSRQAVPHCARSQAGTIRLRGSRRSRYRVHIVSLSILVHLERLIHETTEAWRVRQEAGMNQNRALWIVQGLLAALFLFAGGMKLITPVAVLSVMSPFPGEFIRFIGVCEVLGAVGLIMPYALRILPGLTALAAAGLLVIMVGATVSTLAIGGGLLALPTLVLGLLAALVAYGRRQPLPRAGTTRLELQPAH